MKGSVPEYWYQERLLTFGCVHKQKKLVTREKSAVSVGFIYKEISRKKLKISDTKRVVGYVNCKNFKNRRENLVSGRANISEKI
jgi:hypothetical protein